MNYSFGATIYGFIVGGTVFYIQLIGLGLYLYFSNDFDVHPLLLCAWAIMGVMMIFFILSTLCLAVWILIVLPCSVVYKFFSFHSKAGSMIGAGLGLLVGLFLLPVFKDEGYQAIGLLLVIWSSIVITGTAIGWMLAQPPSCRCWNQSYPRS